MIFNYEYEFYNVKNKGKFIINIFFNTDFGSNFMNQSYDSFDDDIPTNLNICNCKNGGVCVDSKCHCKPGHSGKRCETPICRPACSNGGECIDVNVCNCKDGFTGARCQTGMRQKLFLIFV